MEWTVNVHGSGSDTHTPAIHREIGQGRGEPNLITGFVLPADLHTLSINSVPREDTDAWGASLTGPHVAHGEIRPSTAQLVTLAHGGLVESKKLPVSCGGISAGGAARWSQPLL